jgi:hypothetical protein
MLLAGSTRFLFLCGRGSAGARRGSANASRPPHPPHTAPTRTGLMKGEFVITLARLRTLHDATETGASPRRTCAAPLYPVALLGLSPQRLEQQGNGRPNTRPEGRGRHQTLGHTAVVWAQGCATQQGTYKRTNAQVARTHHATQAFAHWLTVPTVAHNGYQHESLARRLRRRPHGATPLDTGFELV